MSFMDFDELQDEVRRLKEGGNGGGNYLDNFVRMPEGAGHVILRLLPAAPAGMFNRAKSPFFQRTRTHRVNGKSLHCRKEFVKGKWVGECEVCNHCRWLWAESEGKPKDEADRLQGQYRNLKAVERYYYNCVVRQQYNKDTGEVEKNVGPKIFSVGKTIHEMILRAMLGDEVMEEEALGDVTDYVKGRDFKVIKTIKQGSSMSYPDYATSKFLDPSPLGSPDEIEKYTNGLHDLAALRVVKSNEEMKHELKVHLGLATANNSSSYDPSEYGAAPASAPKVERIERIEIPAAPVAPVVEAKKETPKPVDTGSKPLIDEDFLNELRNA
jgi:hypothetical protein